MHSVHVYCRVGSAVTPPACILLSCLLSPLVATLHQRSLTGTVFLPNNLDCNPDNLQTYSMATSSLCPRTLLLGLLTAAECFHHGQAS